MDLLTARVLSAVFEVSNTLGSGFLEKVYERALLKELTMRGIRLLLNVICRDLQGHLVGEYFADIMVKMFL